MAWGSYGPAFEALLAVRRADPQRDRLRLRDVGVGDANLVMSADPEAVGLRVVL